MRVIIDCGHSVKVINCVVFCVWMNRKGKHDLLWQLPRVFHKQCLKLKRVPEGHWISPIYKSTNPQTLPNPLSPIKTSLTILIPINSFALSPAVSCITTVWMSLSFYSSKHASTYNKTLPKSQTVKSIPEESWNTKDLWCLQLPTKLSFCSTTHS